MSKQKKILFADYPKLPLSDDVVKKLQEDSMDWAHAHGLVYRTPEYKDRSDLCMNAPFALLPSVFPKDLFNQAVKIQDDVAKLYLSLAHETDFLISSHSEVVKTDDFIRNMIEILEKVTEEGLSQTFTLAIQRSDYMAHKDPFTKDFSLKQIEVNNIASSMGAHAERTTKMHRRTLEQLGYEKAEIEAAIPKNEPIKMIGEALYHAWEVYGDPNSLILVVVEDVNQNQIDQRHVEYDLESRGIPLQSIVRRSLEELDESLSLGDDRTLLLNGATVSLVYFRSGYSPHNYPSSKEWNVRLTIERSRAIKTPWIGLQVANTKKIQQVLAEDGVLERFVPNPRVANALRATFAGLWPLESSDPMTQKIIKHAERNPEGYVLKPQLEGGHGNYYGNEISEKLRTLSHDEKAAHILMEKLFPDEVKNYLVRAMKPIEFVECVGELGIYGYAYGEKDKEMTARTGGHILRTKGKDVNEGGVAVGASVIDSPFLYEMI